MGDSVRLSEMLWRERMGEHLLGLVKGELDQRVG